ATFTYSALSVGTHTVHADYAGSSGYTGSSGSVSGLAVAQGSTTTSVTASPTSSVFGQPVTFTATVTPIAPSTAAPNGGNVNFYDGAPASGGVLIGPVTASNGTAQLVYNALPVGPHTVFAVFAGNAGYNGSTGTTSEMVTAQGTTSTTVTASASSS